MSADQYGGEPSGGRVQSGSGARGIVLLTVAVVLGIVLLQAFDTGPGSVDRIVTGTPTVTDPDLGSGSGSDTTVDEPESTTTTRALRPPAQVTVLVANGSGVRGYGANTASALKGLGYNTLAAVDTTRPLEATSIQYADDFEPEALAVAKAAKLPANAVQPLTSPPVADVRGAKVVVLLGSDLTPTTTGRAGTTTTARRSTTTR